MQFRFCKGNFFCCFEYNKVFYSVRTWTNNVIHKHRNNINNINNNNNTNICMCILKPRSGVTLQQNVYCIYSIPFVDIDLNKNMLFCCVFFSLFVLLFSFTLSTMRNYIKSYTIFLGQIFPSQWYLFVSKNTSSNNVAPIYYFKNIIFLGDSTFYLFFNQIIAKIVSSNENLWWNVISYHRKCPNNLYTQSDIPQITVSLLEFYECCDFFSSLSKI